MNMRLKVLYCSIYFHFKSIVPSDVGKPIMCLPLFLIREINKNSFEIILIAKLFSGVNTFNTVFIQVNLAGHLYHHYCQFWFYKHHYILINIKRYSHLHFNSVFFSLHFDWMCSHTKGRPKAREVDIPLLIFPKSFYFDFS